MAIELADLREILTLLKASDKSSRKNLLILGSADVHVSAEAYRTLVAEIGFSSCSFPDQLTPFSLGSALGFQVTETMDINGEASITHDLMQVVPSPLHEKYDLIIDAGVLFWCFNPGVALSNIYAMLKPEGNVVHITAVSGFYGRAYYNIHPKLLDDFYGLNGCQFVRSMCRMKVFRLSIWQRLKLRVFRILKLSVRSGFDGPVVDFGYTHLNIKGDSSYFFGTAPSTSPPSIPNDVIGTFVFKKGKQQVALNPILT